MAENGFKSYLVDMLVSSSRAVTLSLVKEMLSSDAVNLLAFCKSIFQKEVDKVGWQDII